MLKGSTPRRVVQRLAASLVLLASVGTAATAATGGQGLTAVPGILVGHHELDERPTGCTVIVAPAGTVGAVDVRGGAPGSRELALLEPWNLVQNVDAIVLSGGSAFGLDAASGAMRWLDEQGRGFDAGVARVPIVPAAILFDLGVGDPAIRPGAECGYRAAARASSSPVAEGNVGAGAGATLGKLAGAGRAMKGGLGSDALVFAAPAVASNNDAKNTETGLVVAALAAVNAVGDVIDPATGEVVAGVRTPDGTALADARQMLLAGAAGRSELGPMQNTTLVVVATNARLDQAAAKKVAQMAHDGLARSLSPVHTPFDGDTVFVLATGTYAATDGREPDLLRLGALAAEATARSVLRAVYAAEGLPGLPAASDLASSPGDDPKAQP